jgi:hypothetical protein
MIRMSTARNVWNRFQQRLSCSYEVRNGESPPPQEIYSSADSAAGRPRGRCNPTQVDTSSTDAKKRGRRRERERSVAKQKRKGNDTGILGMWKVKSTGTGGIPRKPQRDELDGDGHRTELERGAVLPGSVAEGVKSNRPSRPDRHLEPATAVRETEEEERALALGHWLEMLLTVLYLLEILLHIFLL